MIPIPSQIGAYRIVSRIGASSTNDVFLAVSQGPFGFERPVVLKRQRQIDCDFEPSLLAREAQVCAHLEHPAIVRLYDFFEHQGHLVLVREYVEGVPLEALLDVLRIAGERLDDAAALYIGARLFGALAVAHTARDLKSGEYAPVIHRDVTPSNVLVPWDGFAKLADFGFAKVCGRASETASGALKGSLGYMAPEQVAGEPVTARTDVYAGALVVREMLVGTPAFPRGQPELELMRAMAEPVLQPLHRLRPDLPPALLHTLSRALQRDPDQRAMTAEHMQHVLRQHLGDLEVGRDALVATLFRLRTSLLTRTTPRSTPMTPLRIQAVGSVAFPSESRSESSESSAPIALVAHVANGGHVGGYGGYGGYGGHGDPLEPIETPPDSMPTFTVPRPEVPRLPPPGSYALSPRPTPQALSHSVAPTRTVRRSHGPAWAAFVILIASLAGGGFYALQIGSRAQGRTSGGAVLPSIELTTLTIPDPHVLGQAHAPSSLPKSPTPTVATASASASTSAVVHEATTGQLHTPIEASAHRIFVDGRFACVSGKTITLGCGPHVVKVGSMGKPQHVTVPCGGELSVMPKW